MIPYHGFPITPESEAARAMKGCHAFISFRYPEQFGMVLEICRSFAVDNGAFSAWKSGNPITDWSIYYNWIQEIHRYPTFDFSVIPDVIDGSESDNDKLVYAWPWQQSGIGAPVWHLHESLDRLRRLAIHWPRVCIGSSGEYAQIGTQKWWQRMAGAMNVVCDRSGRPMCKLHGLRMLDPNIFTRFPFASADSTNIAQNIGIDSAWKGTYPPATKAGRAMVMRDRIESHQSATFWDRRSAKIQVPMFFGEAV